MSALTGHLKGSSRTPAGDWLTDSGRGDRMAMGIMLGDGTTMQLDGQPTVAVSHGWGEMGWTTFGMLMVNRYGTQPGLT